MLEKNGVAMQFRPVKDREGNETGVKVAIQDDELFIAAPIAPRPSKSFKNILLASTAGNHQVEGLVYDGKPVTVSLNSYVPPTRK